MSFFTSFGYFEGAAEHAQAAGEMARVLRPGGRFAMDLPNLEPTVRDLRPRTERSIGTLRVVEERRYDRSTRRVEKKTVLLEPETPAAAPPVEGASPDKSRSARRKQYFESVRLFTKTEIHDLLGSVGLEIDRVLGDFDGRPYEGDAPRMILLGRRTEREARCQPPH